jgi:hypothetical protein
MHDSCPNCGSKKMIPDLPIIVDVITGGGGVGSATVGVAGAPQAWIFNEVVRGNVTLTVCGECGHAEVHVGNFGRLYENYEKSRKS